MQYTLAMLPGVNHPSIAYVPDCEVDIFISFSHLDNQQEWVSELFRLLSIKVTEELGEKPVIFMDQKLQHGDRLDATIKHKIRRSAVLLTVIAPPYMKSQYCAQELKWFVEEASERHGLRVNDKSRIVPVVKLPVGEWPEDLRKLGPLAAIFYDSDASPPETFPAERNLPRYSDFVQAGNSLAKSLAALLEKIKIVRDQSPPPAPTTIYVAYCARDIRQEREWLVSDLANKGYRVTGQGTPPATEELFGKWLEPQIEDAVLGIHLISSEAGMVPDGTNEMSVVRLQYEQYRRTGKRQLVWFAPLRDVDARKGLSQAQQKLVELLELQRDSQTEVFGTSFSEFKDALPDELGKLEKKSPIQRRRGIYLMCTPGDVERRQLLDLRSYLEEQGFIIFDPAFEGEPATLRELEADSVAANEGTLIYYGTAPDGWVEYKHKTILQVLESLKDRRYPKRAVYLCEPPDKIKNYKYLGRRSQFVMRDAKAAHFGPLYVLGECKPFQPDSVKPFLNALRDNP